MRPHIPALRQAFTAPKVAETRPLDVELIGLATLLAVIVVGHLLTNWP